MAKKRKIKPISGKKKKGKHEKPKSDNKKKISETKLEKISLEKIAKSSEREDNDAEIEETESVSSQTKVSRNIEAPVLQAGEREGLDIRRFFPSAGARNLSEDDENARENFYFSAQNNYASSNNGGGVSYTESQGIFFSEEDKAHRETRKMIKGIDYSPKREMNNGTKERMLGPEETDEHERTKKYISRGEERN